MPLKLPERLEAGTLSTPAIAALAKGIEAVEEIGLDNISRYENMEREADYETLIKFAEYFETSIDYLLGRTDVK